MADSNFMQGNADNAVSVPFSDDETVKDDGLLAEDDSAVASEAERITRKQKRQERIKRLLDEGKQASEEVRSLKEEQSRLRGELGELKGFVSAQSRQQQQPQDGKDDYDRALDMVYEKQSAAYNAAQAEIKAGTFTEERARYYERVAREVETDKSRIHTRRELSMREPAIRQEQAQQVWVQKYPDVYNNPRAFAYAQATFKRRQALNETITNDSVDEIMAETMNTFKLGPKRAPSASDKARMSGLPSSGSGGGSGNGGSSGITMTPQLTRMATAAYSDMSEADAIKKWVNGPGKRLRERKVI